MFSKTHAVFGAIVVAGTMAATSVTLAMPVNFGTANSGNVTPDVIFGMGNENGSWTGVNTGGIEVALRGKLRYNAVGLAENAFHYDNDHTYRFDPIFSDAPSNHSVFNFEYSVNVNSDGSSGYVLSDLNYSLEILKDGTSLGGGDFILYWPSLDNALGTNGTENGEGTVVPTPTNAIEYMNAQAAYNANLDMYNVAQNSLNLGFVFLDILPLDEATYTFNLIVLEGATVLAETSIDVIVGTVPVPAALPLFGTGLAIMGFVGWRRRKVAAKTFAA